MWDAADWPTDEMFDRKNQPQMQEVYKIFLQASYAEATSMWTSYQKVNMPALEEALKKLWEGSYTPCQTVIMSNNPGWTHYIREWTLNT